MKAPSSLQYILFASCFITICVANLWDNLWSNNLADRVVFPSQFDLTLSWHPMQNETRLHPLRTANKTNYVQGHIRIDQKTNRLRMDTKYSTLSLAPQELVSYIIDFENKHLYIKQKTSCKYFDIEIQNIINKSQRNKTEQPETDSENGYAFDVDNLPNIAELFELFPYVMYYVGGKDIENVYMHEFKYSYPLGKANDKQDAEFLAYFTEQQHEPNMVLNTLILTANSLNITDPLKLYAVKPIKEQQLTFSDMSFENLDCIKASLEEHEKLDQYVERIFEIATQTQ